MKEPILEEKYVQIIKAKNLLLKNSVVGALSEIFEEKGAELYLVGGSVRDALMGKLHEDFDFATNLHPKEILSLVKNFAENIWEIGIRFGTIGLEKSGTKIEITTFRQEVYPEDSRHPVVSFAPSIESDLSRRDFTINAMAIKLPEGAFVDPYDGIVDLAEKKLRTPLSPEQSFLDDPLRMLRALRFASTLDMNLTPEVLTAISEYRGRLKIVSRERISDELSKLMLSEAPAKGLKLMVDTLLAEEVIPELLELSRCQDPGLRHKDLLRHTLMVVQNVPADLGLRLGALFHDISKPQTKTIDAEGVHFYQHEVIGAQVAAKRLKALKFPAKVIEEVKNLVALHMRFHTYRLGWTDKGVRKYIRDTGELLSKVNALVRADCTTHNVFLAKKYGTLLDELEKRIIRLEEEEESAKIRPPLDGHEVMEFFHINPGPLVGKILKALLEGRLEGRIKTKEEAYQFLEENREMFKK